MNKKGTIQLSASYIVVIVIMIAIIIIGFNLVSSGISIGKKGVETIENNQKKLIEEDLKSNSIKVSVPLSEVTMKSSVFQDFPIGIKNNLGQNVDFKIFLLFDNAIDSKGNKFVPNNIEKWTFEDPISIKLEDLETRISSLPIYTSGAKEGTYTFSIIVQCNLDPKVCDPYAHRKIIISVE